MAVSTWTRPVTPLCAASSAISGAKPCWASTATVWAPVMAAQVENSPRFAPRSMTHPLAGMVRPVRRYTFRQYISRAPAVYAAGSATTAPVQVLNRAPRRAHTESPD